MRRRTLGAIVGCVAATALITAQPAGAATQVGNPCVGNTGATNFTVYGLAQVSSPYPLTVPSAGVITRWTFNIIPVEVGPIVQSLKVLRSTGVPNQVQVVGESTSVMTSGLNSIPSRIPVLPGDHLGLSGTVEGEVNAVICALTNPADVVGAIPGNLPLGATGTVVTDEGNLAIPIVATVEPDADNDGFGDETQDQCPQLASVQGACPTVTVEASSVIKKKGSVVVLVTASSSAPVNVNGTVNLGKGKKAKLKSKAQTVVPGKTSRFTLKFPKKLKNKLADLERSKSLQLKLTASATDLIGRVTTDQLKTKLKGRAKPAAK
jgi:hypothetical protein